MRAEDHLDVLHEHAPELRIDAVVADPAAVEDVDVLAARQRGRARGCCCGRSAAATAPPRHDPLRLAAAFRTWSRGSSGTSARADLPSGD